MGTDQPNGVHSDETHANNGKTGYDSPLKGVDSENHIPHYNGKGKDVIALYRWAAGPYSSFLSCLDLS